MAKKAEQKGEPHARELCVKAGLLVALVSLVWVSLAFLGKPSAPVMIVLYDDRPPGRDDGQELACQRLGIIQRDQYQTLLDTPLLEHIAWFKNPCSALPNMQDFRVALGSDAHDHSIIAQGGLDLFARSPTSEANSRASNFQLKSDLKKVRENSIWKLDTRNWKVPVPLPTTSNHLHIARIPHREAKPKNVGHVKPDTDREAVWLKTLDLKSTSPMCDAENNGPANQAGVPGGRALRLKPGESYSVGWLFVVTRCHQFGDHCELAPFQSPGKVSCLTPETLTDHVLGMTHLVMPRSRLNAHDSAVDLANGGLALLVGADYDYVPLRVSHYPAAGRQPFSGDEMKAPSAAETPPTKETTIAMLDERIHEILAKIAVAAKGMREGAAKGLREGDFVLILPAALDFKLNSGDYLIVGLDDVPPPLRSHYRGDATSTSTAESSKPLVNIIIRQD